MALRAQVSDRLFVAALTLYLAGAGLYAGGSFAHAMMRAGGWAAEVCTATLGVLALMALADVVVNDMLPARFVWRCGVRYRQGLWGWLAITHVGLAFVSWHYYGIPGAGWLAALYGLCGARGLAISYLDLWHEHALRMRSLQACPRCGRAVDHA